MNIHKTVIHETSFGDMLRRMTDSNLALDQMPEPSRVISTRSLFHVPRVLPPLKAVLFDWDQTMAHSNELYRRTREITFRELFGEDYMRGRDFSSLRGRSVHEYFIEHYRNTGDVDWEEKSRAAYARFVENGKNLFDSLPEQEKTRLFDGARKTLEGLIERGIPVAIVSNAPQEFIHDLMLPKLLGEPLASKLVGVGLTYEEEGKPHTDTCQRALAALKERGFLSDSVDPASIYFVGDSAEHDVEVAYRMSFTPVLYSNHDLDIYCTQLAEDPLSIRASMHRFLYADNHAELQQLFEKALAPSQAISR